MSRKGTMQIFLLVLFLFSAVAQNNLRHRTHHSPLNHFIEVDGLLNREVSIFITSTTSKENTYLTSRIIPSARTWMKLFANVFVLLEDTTAIRFNLRHCRVSEYDRFTTFKCVHEPTYVLTRVCTNVYYSAAGICCKIDEVVNFMVNSNPSLFYNTKFLVEADDDVYLRPEQVLKYLAAVEKSGINHLPIVGSSRVVAEGTTAAHYNSLKDGLGGTGDIWSYKQGCCSEVQASGWYEPFFLNHAALEKISQSTSKFGVRDTCSAFELSQDVGLAVFFWLFELYRIEFPAHMGANNQNQIEFPSNTLGIHPVKHRTMPGGRHGWEDECQPEEGKWPTHLRYNQTLAVGCGNIDTPNPNHDITLGPPDMYDVWRWYQSHTEEMVHGVAGVNNWIEVPVTVPGDGPIDCSNFDTKQIAFDVLIQGKLDDSPLVSGDPARSCKMTIPRLDRLMGYEFTTHSKNNDVVKNWVPFTPKDCKVCGDKG